MDLMCNYTEDYAYVKTPVYFYRNLVMSSSIKLLTKVHTRYIFEYMRI